MPKILVIEDDAFLRELVTQKLSKEGFDVIEAANGEEGVSKAKTESPDCVLLDLILPGIDGFQTLALIRSDAALSSVPVIILSNLGQQDDIDKGLKLGATDYLIKAHFTPGEIIAKIKEILHR